MKKLGILSVIISFLAIPLFANASLLGTGDFDTFHSAPTGGGYYLDYDGTVSSSTFGYTIGLSEVFCVSGQWNTDPSPYAFYTITPDLGAKYAALSKAVWVANNWQNDEYKSLTPDLDTLKGEAQKAVWEIMGVMYIMEGSGTDYKIYSDAMDVVSYTPSGWYLAYSPAVSGTTDYQDFITPVPVPAAMLLFSTGLLGLFGVGIGRKKFIKNIN